MYESSRLRAPGLFTKEALGWNEVSVGVIVIYNHAMASGAESEGEKPGEGFFQEQQSSAPSHGAPEHRLQPLTLSGP